MNNSTSLSLDRCSEGRLSSRPTSAPRKAPLRGSRLSSTLAACLLLALALITHLTAAPIQPGQPWLDTDGQACVFYASEDNATLYISRLNADFTDIERPAVENQTWRRNFPGAFREAPAPFKYAVTTTSSRPVAPAGIPTPPISPSPITLSAPTSPKATPASAPTPTEPSAPKAPSSCPCPTNPASNTSGAQGGGNGVRSVLLI